MSKASDQDKRVKAYILMIIGNEIPAHFDYTSEAKIKWLHSRFISEYGEHIEQLGESKALQSWLQGMAINVACYNSEIIELGIRWGYLAPAVESGAELPASVRAEQKFLYSWFNLLATKTLQLFNKYKG